MNEWFGVSCVGLVYGRRCWVIVERSKGGWIFKGFWKVDKGCCGGRMWFEVINDYFIVFFFFCVNDFK